MVWAIGVIFPARKKDFSLRNFVQTGLGPTPPPDESVSSFHFQDLKGSLKLIIYLHLVRILRLLVVTPLLNQRRHGI
jgi:hypothetical protein